jgi:hypothetical protein
MTQLPLVLVPTYLVPTFLILHLTALFQARYRGSLTHQPSHGKTRRHYAASLGWIGVSIETKLARSSERLAAVPPSA